MQTIALQLERDRLQLRIRRLELVASALRDRAVYRHAVTGTTPPALRRAIESFDLELGGTRRRLRDLASADQADPVLPLGPASG